MYIVPVQKIYTQILHVYIYSRVHCTHAEESGSGSGSESGSDDDVDRTTAAAVGLMTEAQQMAASVGVDPEALSSDAISKAKQSRSEKKARKAMLKLGLKGHPGVEEFSVVSLSHLFPLLCLWISLSLSLSLSHTHTHTHTHTYPLTHTHTHITLVLFSNLLIHSTFTFMYPCTVYG